MSDSKPKYVVKFGPSEADEYTAYNAVEQADGSLRYVDTAGVPHVAERDTWKRIR
jgi:hypothetical protein